MATSFGAVAVLLTTTADAFVATATGVRFAGNILVWNRRRETARARERAATLVREFLRAEQATKVG